MAINELPARCVITCDGCGESVERPSANRPHGWAVLTFEQGAQDFQGAEVADATVRALFCQRCRSKMETAINDAHMALAALDATRPDGEAGE